MTVREFLKEAILIREEVDFFLDPEKPNWAVFDSEVGYLLKSSLMKDGMNSCFTVSHYDPEGYRRMVNFREKTCRINTCGNSFTQCHQVSDGETWQEVLAAHLGEPIRNYGIGGHGVYQAYRRLLKHEDTSEQARFLILNIYDDDHYRSLDAWRGVRTEKFRNRYKEQRKQYAFYFHSNPWAHLELDRDTGEFTERENPYPTPESLYRLCDETHVYEAFGQNLIIQILMARKGDEITNPDGLKRLSELFEVPLDFGSRESLSESIGPLYDRFSFRATEYTLEKVRDFAKARDRELMVLLSYGRRNIQKALEGGDRFDREFLDYLDEAGYTYIDALEAHRRDFAAFRLTPEEYTRRYYVGHYNPLGNHFFAHSIRDGVIDWLDPKPLAYHQKGISSAELMALLA